MKIWNQSRHAWSLTIHLRRTALSLILQGVCSRVLRSALAGTKLRYDETYVSDKHKSSEYFSAFSDKLPRCPWVAHPFPNRVSGPNLTKTRKHQHVDSPLEAAAATVTVCQRDFLRFRCDFRRALAWAGAPHAALPSFLSHDQGRVVTAAAAPR